MNGIILGGRIVTGYESAQIRVRSGIQIRSRIRIEIWILIHIWYSFRFIFKNCFCIFNISSLSRNCKWGYKKQDTGN